MPAIHVKKLSETTFEVSVQDRTPTTHIVSVTPDYAATLCGGRVYTEQPEQMERLMTRSFEFLLQREPNTSILRTFDLPVIGRYFPEYEREIIKLLKQPDTKA